MITVVTALMASLAAQEEGFESIFNGRDLAGWTHYLRPGKDGRTPGRDEVWSVADGVIRCKGKPAGYIRTEKDYTNYVLKLEWRWSGRPGNSGVLCRMVGEDKVWPKSVEAQLMNRHAGDFWLIGGVTLETPKDRVDPKVPRHRLHARMAEKDPGEWNEYEITMDGGRVTLRINGELVNEGTGAEVVAGKICLQSEGAPIEFRNIRIKELK